MTTVTTRIVYKIRGSSFSLKNLNLEWIKNANDKDCLSEGIKNEHRSNPFLYTILVVIVWFRVLQKTKTSKTKKLDDRVIVIVLVVFEAKVFLKKKL